MNLWHSIVLGIVEGISEFLPISSTGHLILTSSALNIPDTDFLKSFEICIQSGAILSVIVLYWKRFFLSPEILKRVGFACLPVFTVGFVLYKVIKKFLMGNNLIVMATLFLGGIFLIVFEWKNRRKRFNVTAIESISYKQSLLIGFSQVVAIIPGVSRSAASMVGAMWIGIDRKTAAEFSFLLAVPTLGAATALDLLKNASSFSGDNWLTLLLGFIVSFIVAMLAIKFLMAFLRHATLAWFGVYRIIAAYLFWMFV